MTRVTTPGFYDHDEATYHADPCVEPSLSSGIAAQLVIGTPSQAKHKHPRLNPDFEVEDQTKYDLGNVAHELVLGRGKGIRVIDAEDWRKKATQEERDEILAAGGTPCLAPVYEKAAAMRAALFEQLACDAENREAFQPDKGKPEQALYWQHRPLHAPRLIWCRALLDWRVTDRPVIYDYKTFAGEKGADPEAFVKHIVSAGRDVQDPHYSSGLAAELGLSIDDVVFRYVVQEPKPPFNAVVVELDAATKAFAHERWTYAVEKWAQCRAADQWPGFPPRTHYAGAPGWAQAQWADKMLAEEQLGRVQEVEGE